MENVEIWLNTWEICMYEQLIHQSEFLTTITTGELSDIEIEN